MLIKYTFISFQKKIPCILLNCNKNQCARVITDIPSLIVLKAHDVHIILLSYIAHSLLFAEEGERDAINANFSFCQFSFATFVYVCVCVESFPAFPQQLLK